MFAAPTCSNPTFWEAARDARKVMVVDLGFLGDTVHLLPALWAIRQAWPNAEIHVMVAEHVTQLLQVAPWMDRVWGYPRFPKGPKPWQDFGRIRALRSARFDAVINLNGSDRSSLLTWVSGARCRLGRRPEGGGPWHWSFQFSHVVEFPYKTMPVWKQRWACLQKAGVPIQDEPRFHVTLSDQPRRAFGITSAEDGTYFHISPFTTQDLKELPLAQLASLVSGLGDRFPEKRIVLSCAPNDRERSKLQALIEQLPIAPWKVFAGELGLMELVSVLSGAVLHFGGDSGALHLALMTGIPTVSWFRDYPGVNDWAPQGKGHRVLVGTATSDGEQEGVRGVEADDLIAAATEIFSCRD